VLRQDIIQRKAAAAKKGNRYEELGDEEDFDETDDPSALLQQESEESRGYMWRNTSSELVSEFVPKMSRFVWKILNDRALLREYHKGEGARFDQLTRKRVQAFVTKRCSTEQDDATLAEFRRFTAEFCLPVGWETHHSRSGQVADDPSVAADTLNDILGARLTGFVRQSTMVEMCKIVRFSHEAASLQDESIHYEPIVLTQVDAFLKAKQAFKWSKEYYCVLPHAKEWRERFASDHHMGKPPRPIVVKNVQKQFHVFYKKTFYPVGYRFSDAFCLWLFFVHRDFASYVGNNDRLQLLLESDQDVACMYNELQPSLDVAENRADDNPAIALVQSLDEDEIMREAPREELFQSVQVEDAPPGDQYEEEEESKSNAGQ
jgi:hypothetical protein